MLWFSPTLADWRAGQESGRIVEVFFPRELADEVNAISFMCADNVGLLNQRLSEAHAAMNYAWAWGRGTYPFGWANYDQDPGKIREALNIMAMMNMPILSSCVIRSDGSYVSDMWTNREVLAIFDDPLAIPAHSAFSNNLAEIWVRPLQAPGCGSNAVCFVNGGPPDGPSVTLTLTAQMLGLASNAPVQLYDPWGHTNVAIFTNAYTYSITSSNVNMFTAWPANPSLSIPAPSATPPINPSQIKAWLDVKLPNGEILKTPLYE
jgi:hypothetical protein